jgi:hypothetical protein
MNMIAESERMRVKPPRCSLRLLNVNMVNLLVCLSGAGLEFQFPQRAESEK